MCFQFINTKHCSIRCSHVSINSDVQNTSTAKLCYNVFSGSKKIVQYICGISDILYKSNTSNVLAGSKKISTVYLRYVICGFRFQFGKNNAN